MRCVVGEQVHFGLRSLTSCHAGDEPLCIWSVWNTKIVCVDSDISHFLLQSVCFNTSNSVSCATSGHCVDFPSFTTYFSLLAQD